MPNFRLDIFDVEHGACAIAHSPDRRAVAMIDSGDNTTTGWTPSAHIRWALGRTYLDYLLITNADQDHMSDLDGLRRAGISVGVFVRNRSINAAALQNIKEQSGPLTADAQQYLSLHTSHVGPVTADFRTAMGGVELTTFCNQYPRFTDTNNLSLVAFLKYGGFKILFPGDL